MGFMVLQPPSCNSSQPDGSGDYHVEEFGDEAAALAFCKAARSVATPSHAKKIRVLRYVELLGIDGDLIDLRLDLGIQRR